MISSSPACLFSEQPQSEVLQMLQLWNSSPLCTNKKKTLQEFKIWCRPHLARASPCVWRSCPWVTGCAFCWHWNLPRIPRHPQVYSEASRERRIQELKQSAQTVPGYQHKQEGFLTLTILGNTSAKGFFKTWPCSGSHRNSLIHCVKHWV